MEVALVVGFACLSRADAQAAKFQYTLSGVMKPNAAGVCSTNDVDADCLDDAREAELAAILAPYFLWAGDDGCNFYSSQNAFNEQHFKPRIFHQIRPAEVGSYVSNWRTGHSTMFVSVTYHFNYPEDCTSDLFDAGHTGDNEKVTFFLSSDNLQQWTVENGRYYYHSETMLRTGDDIHALATSVGRFYPVILGSEDSHASYWGDSAASDDCCAGCTGLFSDTCLTGSLLSSLNNGNWVFAFGVNIGGPPPEQWNFNVLGNANGVPFSAPDTGHGWSPDFWDTYWPDPSQSAKFCGFSCTSVYSNGNCAHVTHFGNQVCSVALKDSTIKHAFEVWP